MKLQSLVETFAVCRMNPNEGIPLWAMASDFFSISKTSDELSIICAQSLVPDHVQKETDWRCFRVVGTLEFHLTGILAGLTVPLAKAAIGIFAISTFDTDYLMVKASKFEEAKRVLSDAGHSVDLL